MFDAAISTFISYLSKQLPVRCLLCQQSLGHSNFPWCDCCHQRLPDPPRCTRCGSLTREPEKQCFNCLQHPPAWDKLTCISSYCYPYDKLLHRFKYQGQYWLAPFLAQLLSPKISHPVSLLLPVPMHWQRRITRGFNHSAVLAHALAKQCDVECWPQALERVRATRQQQGLNRQARLSNLSQAFAVTTPLPARVALVDDVVTTGATINKLCALLRAQGVEHIEVYALLRSSKLNP